MIRMRRERGWHRAVVNFVKRKRVMKRVRRGGSEEFKGKARKILSRGIKSVSGLERLRR
jgi:hypothetical protein